MTDCIWFWKHNSKIHFLAVRQWYSHYRVAAGMGLLNQKLFTSYIKIHSSSIWLYPPTDLLNFLSCSAFPSSQLKTTVLSVPSSAITPSFSGSTCTNSDGAASYYQCLLYFLLKDTTLQSGVLPHPPNCKQHSQSGSSFENFHVSGVKQLSQKYCQARGIILNATELSSWHKAPRSDLIHVFKSISGCHFPFMMVSHIPPDLQHTVRT